ncbi:MAG TPA: signal peptide peptidase SppA [Alphaproteobacteria bacterium]|nr:signal peptide peptidase SppA [Alphaproteobacteria bacterium]
MTSDPFADPAHLIPATSRLRRSRSLWRVLFFLALAVAVVAMVGRFALDGGAVGDRIARITVSGTIVSDPARVAALQKLAEDPLVKGVIVAINSPGGTTAGGEELYEALAALRAEKPVVAVISELGASAAYMTAIAADRIFARRLSIVGSIGVLYQHVNAGKLLATIGVDFDKVQTGPLKAEPDFDEPMVGEVRASLQRLVDDSFAWFVDIVAERRGIARPDVLALADGRIVTGRQGVDLRLIDAIGGETEAIAWLEAERQLAADLPVVDYYPPPDPGWVNVPKWLGEAARSALGLGPSAPIALDGLVSLWQAAPTM